MNPESLIVTAALLGCGIGMLWAFAIACLQSEPQSTDTLIVSLALVVLAAILGFFLVFLYEESSKAPTFELRGCEAVPLE